MLEIVQFEVEVLDTVSFVWDEALSAIHRRSLFGSRWLRLPGSRSNCGSRSQSDGLSRSRWRGWGALG